MRVIPLHREYAEKDSALPEGMTCGDCVFWMACCNYFGHIPSDEVCNWSPSRFVSREMKKAEIAYKYEAKRASVKRPAPSEQILK